MNRPNLAGLNVAAMDLFDGTVRVSPVVGAQTGISAEQAPRSNVGDDTREPLCTSRQSGFSGRDNAITVSHVLAKAIRLR